MLVSYAISDNVPHQAAATYISKDMAGCLIALGKQGT